MTASGAGRILRILLFGLVGLVGLVACGEEEQSAPALGFEDVRAKAGIEFHMSFLTGEQGETFKINFYDHGAGISAGDYDNDGDDDLYFTNQLGPNALYRNNGDGTFSDVTEQSGPIGLPDRICVCSLFNDLDNDGDQDLFVTSTRGGNVLFRNRGDGRFEDVTEQAGLTWIGHTQNASAFDADGDGDLDLLICNTAGWTTGVRHAQEGYYEGVPGLRELVGSIKERNVYYRNRGDGTFEVATDEAGLGGPGWGGDVAAFDYDYDGDTDVFVANMFGRSTLYRNNGKGRFENATRSALGPTPFGTVGARAFDYDGDGLLDLFLVDMHSDMWMMSDHDPESIDERRKYSTFFGAAAEAPGFDVRRARHFEARMGIRPDDVFYGNALYRNKGDGTFEELSDTAGTETFWPWGVAAGDFDNDGFTDVFVPSGMGYPFFYWRNYLLMNNRDGTFTDRSRQAGLDPPPGGKFWGKVADRPAVRSARSAAVLDFDADGRLDVVVSNFNDRPNLFRNRWPKRAYVAFRLEGTRSNRDAIGALLRLTVDSKVLVRMVQAAGGYLAQSTKVVHFGLAPDAQVEKCEIRWPSGQTQILSKPELNRTHAVQEPR